MAQVQKENEEPLILISTSTPDLLHSQTIDSTSTTNILQEKEEDKEHSIVAPDESGHSNPSPVVSSRVLYLLGDITSGPAFRFAQWLDSVRSRSGKYQSTVGLRHRHSTAEIMPFSSGEQIVDSTSSQRSEQASEISLWERLGRASTSDIDSIEFSWGMLTSLHRTENSSSTEYSEDELNKALEVCNPFPLEILASQGRISSTGP